MQRDALQELSVLSGTFNAEYGEAMSGIVNLITREYPKLSPGYQQIARFFTQNPNAIALESINALAAKCGVHPSSLVRFSQNLGDKGRRIERQS